MLTALIKASHQHQCKFRFRIRLRLAWFLVVPCFRRANLIYRGITLTRLWIGKLLRSKTLYWVKKKITSSLTPHLALQSLPCLRHKPLSAAALSLEELRRVENLIWCSTTVMTFSRLIPPLHFVYPFRTYPQASAAIPGPLQGVRWLVSGTITRPSKPPDLIPAGQWHCTNHLGPVPFRKNCPKHEAGWAASRKFFLYHDFVFSHK